MMNTRRNFLKKIAYSAGATAALNRLGGINAFAQTAVGAATGYQALVCVFLYGGNDSNNMIVPTLPDEFKNYQQYRGNLALSTTSLIQSQLVPYAFHTALTSMQQLFDQKHLAIVANTGPLLGVTAQSDLTDLRKLPYNLYSHSDQQMQWQTSKSDMPGPNGWAGRLADQIVSLNNGSSFPTFITVGGNTIEGVGTNTRIGSLIPNSPLGVLEPNGTPAPPNSDLASAISSMTSCCGSGAVLVGRGTSLFTNGLSDEAQVQNVLNPAPTFSTPFPATPIGQQLLEVAQLINGRQTLQMNRQIFFVSMGGFDTHTAEKDTQQALFGQLADALSAFYNCTVNDLKIPEQITTFTESDFSRTLQPNSNGGSDHGWGSHHMVLGGAVAGGQIYGHFQPMALGAGTLDAGQGRWIPTTSVDTYGATFADWFGAGASIGKIFPNLTKFPVQKLLFLTKPPVS